MLTIFLGLAVWAVVLLFLAVVIGVMYEVPITREWLPSSLPALPTWLTQHFDDAGEIEAWLIRGVAAASIVGGFWSSQHSEHVFWNDLWPEMVGIGFTVLAIEELSRRRSQKEVKRLEQLAKERAAADYKRQIIRQMRSQSNEFALEAVRIARDEGWLYDGSLVGADLEGANLQAADLGGTNLRGAKLYRADLEGAILWNATLQGADLQEANLERAHLLDANLQGAYLQGAHLEGANLYYANLQEAELLGADLQGAKLLGADLQRANLMDAKLRGADLYSAKLQGVYLTDATLEGAILDFANLQGAYLSGANLQGAEYTDNTTWPDGFDPIAASAVLIDVRH